MPLRTYSRDQAWLFPPTLEELIPATHPARFVGAFVDGLERAEWDAMEIALDGNPKGAPAYDPRVLLAVWLYGFMTGVRSSRKLEQACRDCISYLWLTGWQQPDHNTLWRFYQANREQLRKLLKRTVRVALDLELVDLALQAIDGTRLAANASRDRMFDAAGMQRLLDRVDGAIADLEAQNKGNDAPAVPDLPEQLSETKALKERIEQAQQRLRNGEQRKWVNLTDGDASLVRSHPRVMVGYNCQAVVSPVHQGESSGLLIVAAEVAEVSNDQGQLAPMIQAARARLGSVEVTAADAGYHSGQNLETCAALNQRVVMPEARSRDVQENPYHKDRFVYHAATDTYRCPEGKTLHFVGAKHKHGIGVLRGYRASPDDCVVCPAFGRCTTNARLGRRLDVRPTDQALRTHRLWMQTKEAKRLYKRRKELVEPAFGILKEQMGARRLLLRGFAQVRAEWSLLAVAFNLRALWKLTATTARRAATA